MDHLLVLIVRFVAWISRFARWLPGVHLSRWDGAQTSARPMKILLVGYNGARNTGADVRVSALIDQLSAQFAGRDVRFTVMSLDPSNTGVYFDGRAKTIGFSTMFFLPLLRACSSHDVIVLCEGSMLKSKFANGLSLFMCEAAGIAKAQGKPCVAYGVEVGEMEPFLRRTARSMCSDVHFVVRTPGSLEALRDLGLDGILGTDTAWTFESDSGSQAAGELLAEQGWDGRRPIVGAAVINPYCWPARPSIARTIRSALTGHWEMHYQKWYFFSWDKKRAAKLDAYLTNMARAINEHVRKTGAFVMVIGMERLDRPACERLVSLLDEPCGMMISDEWDGFVIGEVLRRLDVLVTSRYHASVLAMKEGVPAVAVSMDERLANLYEEAGLEPALLCGTDDPGLAESVGAGLACVEGKRAEIEERIGAYRKGRIARCSAMAQEFDEYLAACLPGW